MLETNARRIPASSFEHDISNLYLFWHVKKISELYTAG
jgi:hypothetical protein